MKAVITHLNGELFANLVDEALQISEGERWTPEGASFSVNSIKNTLADITFWDASPETAEILSDAQEVMEEYTPKEISLLCYDNYEVVKVVHSSW